jgi:uncharacterized protein YuzE
MDITYDPKYNLAEIRFQGKTAGVKTVQIGEEINVDICPEGKVCGIELMNAREQLASGNRISFRDESTGKTLEIPISF